MSANADKHFHIWGVLRGPYVFFRAVRPHHRVDKFITMEKNYHQLFVYGPQCEKMRILGYSGGGGAGAGWPINKQTGPILLPNYPSYPETDEVSADASDAGERNDN